MSTSQITPTKRISLIISSLEVGGIQRMRIQLANKLSEMGNKVDLVVVNAKGPLKTLIGSGVCVVNLNATRSLTALPKLLKYFYKVRPSVVLSAQTHLNLLVIWAKQYVRQNFRLIVSEHIDIAMASHNGENLAQRLIPLGTAIFYPRADQVIAVSNGVKESLIQTGRVPENLIRTIYNPVVTPAMLQQMKYPVDHPWFQQNHPPVIISAGRLTKQKDHGTLLQAFALLRKTMRAKLIILGDGEERYALERLTQKLNLQDDISLPGFVENPFHYMKCANLFVLSSRWEGFGNVLVEAMACEVPIVSTDCPSGPSEILENGKYGLLIPIGDADALAGAMLKMLKEPYPLPNFLYERAMEYSVETIIHQYLNVLQPAQFE